MVNVIGWIFSLLLQMHLNAFATAENRTEVFICLNADVKLSPPWQLNVDSVYLKLVE